MVARERGLATTVVDPALDRVRGFEEQAELHLAVAIERMHKSVIGERATRVERMHKRVSSLSAHRPASRHRHQHTGHRADTYIYIICIHMHVYICRGAPPPSFAHAFLCIRWSTAALVHPCVQTYIWRSGAPPLLSHRPLSRPSRSTFVLSLSLTLNNHTRANCVGD